MNAVPLYTVTVMHPDVLFARAAGKHPSTVAACTSLEEAKEIVEQNVLDIYEYEYAYAVIELTSTHSVQGVGPKHPDPAHPSRKAWEQWWYTWDKEHDGYVVWARPDPALRIVAWAGF